MSNLSTRYTPESARLISKLPPEIKRLVRSSVDRLLSVPTVGTELTGELDGYLSYRVRRYRIIYRVNEMNLTSRSITWDINGTYTKHCGR